MILNLFNNKFYIGSSQNIIKRINAHKSMFRNKNHPNIHLRNSYNKYGDKYFIYLLIEKVENINDLLNREQYWIDELDATNQIIAYNICPNATNMLGFRHSEETKKYLSDIAKGENGSFYGKHHTEESKQKISNKNSNPTPETRLKKSIAGKKTAEYLIPKLTELKFKPVIQLDKDLNFIAKFESIKQAVELTNTRQADISNCCNYKRRKANGFIWVFESEYLNEDYKSKLYGNKLLTKVCQYDLNNNLIKIWDSITEPSQFYNINKSNISNCCAGRHETAKGFIWKYYKDVFPIAI